MEKEDNKKVIKDVEIRNATKKDGAYIFYVWD